MSLYVPGEGPKEPAPLAFVAEAPAHNEVREGRPLVGVSGDLNWQLALRYGGLLRVGAYVTNWRKVPFTDEKKEVSPEEAAEWTAVLEAELKERVQPGGKVVALGAWSTRALLGPEYNLYWANGLAVDRGDFVIFPVVHPAAGLHEPGMLVRTALGYKGVRRAIEPPRLHGRWNPDPEIRHWLPYMGFGADVTHVFIDTEGSKSRPYMLTFATRPEVGYVIYAEQKAELTAFFEALKTLRPTLGLHNALHDADVLLAMGFDIWEFEVVDTMVLAYNLQDVPRDLKNLTRHLLNVHMEEYEEVVRPYQEVADAAWKEQVYQAAARELDFQLQLTAKGKPRTKGGQPLYKRIGPPLLLKIATHLERDQQLSPMEEHWAERTVGRRPSWELSLVPREVAEPYAGKDATSTAGVFRVLSRRVEEEGLGAVATLDNAVLPLVSDMMRAGMHLDIERYWQVLGEMSSQRQATLQRVREIVRDSGYRIHIGKHENPEIPWEEFNPNSGDQVAEFCRQEWIRTGKLGLTKLTRKKTRESTAGDILAQLRADHPIIPSILEYRELAVYEDRYLLPMQPLIKQMPEKDEYRVFVKLNAATVVSGRLSSGGTDLDTGEKTPNALAWPTATDLGTRLRWIFTAPRGMDLVSWDLSQVELRLAAAFSGEPVMIEAFLKGLDLHSNLGARLFGVSYDVANEGPGRKKYRGPAKNIHYMLMYGGTAYKLFEMMGGALPFEQCVAMFRDTWALYKTLKAHIIACGVEARQTGEVRDFLGRRRFLPGIRLVGEEFSQLAAEAERQSWNFKAQAGASELLKKSMDTTYRVVYPRCRQEGIHFRLWLQIHDELMGELEQGEVIWEKVNRWMTEAMTQDGWLTHPVPIVTEGKRGRDWSELK